MARPRRNTVAADRTHGDHEREATPAAAGRDGTDDATPADPAGAAVRLEAVKSWYVERPIPEFMELPVRYRWEFTRRHPQYLRFWRFARPDVRPRTRDEEEIAATARPLVQALGLTDVPPPPGTPFEELSEGALAGGWEAGAVSRPTLKGLVSTLALLAPQDLLGEIGGYLAEIGRHPDGSVEKRNELLRPLLEADVPALNFVPPLMLTVNPYAPQTAIEAAVLTFARRWKGELGAGARPGPGRSCCTRRSPSGTSARAGPATATTSRPRRR